MDAAAKPWEDEPDRAEWRAHGLPCLAVRARTGAWCGYVAIGCGHPLHGVGQHGAQHKKLSVHGGITYARACNDHICHNPAPGESDDVWWLGWDCGHAGDLMPEADPFTVKALHFADTLNFMLTHLSGDDNEGASAKSVGKLVYRDLAFVRAETERLAAQLAAMASA